MVTTNIYIPDPGRNLLISSGTVSLLRPNYINAGVLLFNLAEMKQTGLLQKARELIKTKKLTFADQSAIYRSTTCKKMLPQRFNDQKFLHKHTVITNASKAF
ncbi:MAG: hypothetical protein IKK33_11115 [Lachnospiraceae bacterium]|nr:hypothetical protein [Lachnospiraceae bacterium]